MHHALKNIRTDLASEAFAAVPEVRGARIEEKRPQEGVSVTRVEILNEEGEEALGKPRGNYITIDAPELRNNDPLLRERVVQVLAEELRALCGPLEDRDTVLIAGLGNRTITADALGPDVTERVMVSRHVTEYLPEQVDERVRPVCAMAPGVLGVTGIETGEMVLGAVERVRPRLVIAVDALASRSTERISTTVQLADTGIRPGSGLGGGRMELTRETLGVPVIAIGVPTVVHASTISQDAVTLLLEEMGAEAEGEELVELVGRVVSEKIGPLIVTPKEIDCIIERSADLVAAGIDLALHGVTLEELRRFLR